MVIQALPKRSCSGKSSALYVCSPDGIFEAIPRIGCIVGLTSIHVTSLGWCTRWHLVHPLMLCGRRGVRGLRGDCSGPIRAAHLIASDADPGARAAVGAGGIFGSQRSRSATVANVAARSLTGVAWGSCSTACMNVKQASKCVAHVASKQLTVFAIVLGCEAS